MRFLLLILLLCTPIQAVAQTSGADIEINKHSVRFSVDPLIAGEEARLYASVRNIGNVDVSGYVYFYQGPTPLGPSQVISLAADGESEDVWIDFIIPEGPFNIRAELRGINPPDEYAGNNEYLSNLFVPVFDSDADGVIDEEDNCRDTPNADQRDDDADGEGYACDEDERNAENVSDSEPITVGSNDQSGELVDAPLLEPELGVLPSVNPIIMTDISERGVANVMKEDYSTEFTIEEIADNTAGERVSFGSYFTYEVLKWRAYAFRVIDAQDNISYKWDFGDGSSSVQTSIGHEFRGPGTYKVTLTALHDDGITTTDEALLTVSFFHIQNPLVQLIITLLVLLILLTLVGVLGLKTRGTKRRRILTTEDGVLYTKGQKTLEPDAEKKQRRKNT
ncbi:MAG: PKD domain-containing protein [bacterium]|nr:PKD domain-containing protein [bacterium]MDA1024425.1 PKD domain-containing protein [bacterium]